MRRLSIRRSSNNALLLAVAGVGALAAYALSSPQRRAALRAGGQSAVDAGSKLLAASAERLGIRQPSGSRPLAESFETSTAKQPETFRDEATGEKVVEIGADKTRAPIHGIDPPERPGR